MSATAQVLEGIEEITRVTAEDADGNTVGVMHSLITVTPVPQEVTIEWPTEAPETTTTGGWT